MYLSFQLPFPFYSWVPSWLYHLRCSMHLGVWSAQLLCMSPSSPRGTFGCGIYCPIGIISVFLQLIIKPSFTCWLTYGLGCFCHTLLIFLKECDVICLVQIWQFYLWVPGTTSGDESQPGVLSINCCLRDEVYGQSKQEGWPDVSLSHACYNVKPVGQSSFTPHSTSIPV